MDHCRITTGLPELDKALGGWRKGGPTTIYNPGSSAICETIILMSAEILSSKGFKVLYLDATGNALFKSLSNDDLTLLEIREWDEQREIISIINLITYHFYPLVRVVDDHFREKLIEMLHTTIVELKRYASLMDSVVIYVTGTRRVSGKYPCLGGTLTYEPADMIIEIMPSKKWDIRKITILDKKSGHVPKLAHGFLYIKKDDTVRIKLWVRENEL